MLKRFLAFVILFLGILNQVYAYSGDLIPQSQPSLASWEEGVEQESSPQPSPTGEGEEQIVDLVVEETSNGSNQSSTGDTDNGSGTVEFSSGTTDSGSGEVYVYTGVLDDYSERFAIVFQNPSYLFDKDLALDSYNCDDSQEECKVNFNIDDLELSTFSTKFYCNIDFGFITGEEDKCNPATVVFGTGTFDIDFQIYKVEDDSLIWEKTIKIINEISDLGEDDKKGSGSIDSGTGDIETSSGEINTGSGEIEQSSFQPSPIGEGAEQGSGTIDTELWSGGLEIGDVLEIPKPIIEVQSGLNYLTGTIWQCKNEICKINLNGESSFTGGFIESDFECLWSFSGGSFITQGTESKCNPGYVDYGTGEYEVGFKIYEKGNLENFKEAFIEIQNQTSSLAPLLKSEGNSTGSGEIDSSTGETESGSLETIIPPSVGEEQKSGGGGGALGSSYIEEKEIIVQSGLDYINGTYRCSEERCKINLEYNESSGETCLWDFGGGDYKEKYLTTCNPGFIYYASGEYKISLNIYKNLNFYKSKTIKFRNIYLDKLKQNNKKPQAKINLQGTIAKYKELNGNKLICRDVNECSVNFTGEESIDENTKNLTYLWDFGNGEIFFGVNPKSIKYTLGKYEVTLTVIDELGEKDISYFFVEVYGDKIVDIIIDENIFSNLKISGVLPNNSGVDDYEWFEIENIGSEVLNLKGVIIDDIVGKGSKAYKIDYDLFLYPHKKKRFYKSKTGLSLGNTLDELNIIYNEKIVDSLAWDFNVPDDFIITHENVLRPLQKVFVERVVDGDTMDVIFENGNIERLRLIGVDTPETKHPRKPVEEFGIEAYNFTKKTLEGKYVLLETGIEDRGKYGRLLAYIYIDETTSFNEMLIEKGYARAYLKYPFKYSKLYASLEKQAKKNKVGLWGNKEVLEVIKEWIEEDEEYIEEFKIEELYNFSDIFLNGLNIDEFKRKSGMIQYDIASRFDETKKNVSFKNDWFSVSKTKVKNTDEVVELEKELKSSITYRVSKQKKGLKITGNSKEYKNLIMVFDGEKINLKTDENGDFIYYTTVVKSGDFILEFYGLDEAVGEIFLKNSRAISLSPEYVENMQTYKIKLSSKIASKNQDKPIKLNIVPELTNEIAVSKYSIHLLLNLLLGLLVLFFMYLVLRKRRIL
ncbi:MAG: thermonuclease family protein [Candidatus Gracilibacteria bacterium]|nr:thermonuclease family protein [Candidatus Gracilibacteria bacterium]